MSKETLTDVIGLTSIALWLVVSGYFAVIGHADFFQRMGAAGVAVAVGYFALVRHGVEVYPSLLERLNIAQKSRLLHAQMIETSLQNSSIVAVELNRLRTELSLSPSEPCKALGTFLYEAEKANGIQAAELSDRIDCSLAAEKSASERVSRQRRISESFQMIVVVLATLQWGFGDLLIEGSA